MKSIINIFLTAALLILTQACDFNKYPADTLDPNSSFGAETDLVLYTNSFYKMLPTGQEVYTKDGALSDYMASASGVSTLLYGNYTNQESELKGWWNWEDLRSINYFLENNVNEQMPQEIRDEYNGMARFFRAWFYFTKVKTFGNVPWYSKVLSTTDNDLYKTQDSRVLVMQKVVEDLDFAIANLSESKSKDASIINKWCALALKSRICLYEGTYRKYSGKSELASTANEYLTEAANAAQELINNGGFSLNNSGATPYRDLFTSTSPFTNEVILIDTYSESLARYHSANWLFTSTSTGNRPSLTKDFVNTFLNIDGSRFTDNANYNSTLFTEEVEGRDSRLAQIIRTPGYTLLGKGAAPDFGHALSGYQIIKYVQDNNANMAMSKNSNSIPLIRYAEVLLNYAEAKAELAEMSDDIWDKTVGELRARAGIADCSRASSIDTYMQGFYPNISSADILEIRRERAIELCCEGFRLDDIKRWRAGELLERTWNGMYIPQMNKLIDLNSDGVADICFCESVPETPQAGVYYFTVTESCNINSNGNIEIFPNITKKFEDKKYLYPVPESAMLLNNNLEQTELW